MNEEFIRVTIEELMQPADFDQLIDDVKSELALGPKKRFAILGHTPVTYSLLAFFRGIEATGCVTGIYDDSPPSSEQCKPISRLGADAPDVVVIASDNLKEDLLQKAVPHLVPRTKILLAGYGHFSFRKTEFESAIQEALVPSLANGYPNTLVHLYQCLENAARRDLKGVVAEFGMFKGGTTMLLSRFVEQLGTDWKVIGFDTFSGFPPRRNVLDMYSHPGCVFHDEAGVRNYLAGRNVEIVAGDIVHTADRLRAEDVVMAFVDTDNYSSATAVLDVIEDRVVAGGSIIFDHFTGRGRFRYTLGERLAAKRLLANPNYFNLHDTGVFFKQT